MIKKNVKENSTIVRNIIFFLGICGFFYLLLKYQLSPTEHKNPISEQFALQRTLDNYYEEIDSIASGFDVNTNYLLALTMLECSGRTIYKPRFEKHVYEKLKKARDNRKSFGSISYKTISDASDEALKNLATSWGPFQLMGYQCIELDVHVADIRGEHAVYWGIYWIYKRYGKQLKKGDYKNAFHIHNTGQKIPLTGKYKTFDPNYVIKGISYMNYFQKKLSSNN